MNRSMIVWLVSFGLACPSQAMPFRHTEAVASHAGDFSVMAVNPRPIAGFTGRSVVELRAQLRRHARYELINPWDVLNADEMRFVYHLLLGRPVQKARRGLALSDDHIRRLLWVHPSTPLWSRKLLEGVRFSSYVHNRLIVVPDEELIGSLVQWFNTGSEWGRQWVRSLWQGYQSPYAIRQQLGLSRQESKALHDEMAQMLYMLARTPFWIPWRLNVSLAAYILLWAQTANQLGERSLKSAPSGAPHAVRTAT